MATLTGSTIASTYNLLVKRNETYSQTGTNIELMIADGTVAPTGLYLESGATTDNVGIGTATPNNILTVYDATTSIIQVTNNFGGVGVAADAGLKIQYYEDDASIINQDADGKMHLGCADSIDMTILASGNVGIGTAAPYSPLHIKGAGEGQIADGSSNIPQLLIEGTAHTVGDSGPILCLWNSGDSADNDYIGKISFVAGDDTGATTALTTGTEYASIVARISDETDSTTDGLL